MILQRCSLSYRCYIGSLKKNGSSLKHTCVSWKKLFFSETSTFRAKEDGVFQMVCSEETLRKEAALLWTAALVVLVFWNEPLLLSRRRRTMVRFWRTAQNNSFLQEKNRSVFQEKKHMVLTTLLVEQEPGLTSLHGLFRRKETFRKETVLFKEPLFVSEKKNPSSSWKGTRRRSQGLLCFFFSELTTISQRYDSSTLFVVISLLYCCYIASFKRILLFFCSEKTLKQI